MQLANSSGVVTKVYQYDAFGVEKDKDATDNNPFRYCGEYFDKETGTIYLRARHYNPSTGRFISQDSVAGKASDPLSLNLYTYGHSNPVRFIDPSGHTAKSGSKTQFMSFRENYALASMSGREKRQAYDRALLNMGGSGLRSGDVGVVKSFSGGMGNIGAYSKKGAGNANLITKEKLSSIGWNASDSFISEFNLALQNVGITDPKEIRHLIVQMAHESKGGLLEKWNGNSPEEYFADLDYRKDLGNNAKGDGAKYRGAGYIQITGKSNYAAFADEMGDPRVLSEGSTYVAENYPIEASLFWWKSNNMGIYILDGTYSDLNVSQHVNGGRGGYFNNITPNGWKERENLYNLYNLYDK